MNELFIKIEWNSGLVIKRLSNIFVLFSLFFKKLPKVYKKGYVNGSLFPKISHN